MIKARTGCEMDGCSETDVGFPLYERLMQMFTVLDRSEGTDGL